ncbi:MAG: glycosyltransferase [Desulfovibrio sp.]|jgi:glycosyltransferase involved in cell wall biosynthesis|nr:glycosyltransferase [Desulfovibrio sp.]
MTRPLRILFLMEDLCFGGTQRQMLELVLRLDRTHFLPSILTLTGRTDLDEVAEAAGIGISRLGTGRTVPGSFFLRLYRALKAAGQDILIPCTALPNIWGRIWGRATGMPVIVGTCRGGGAPRRQHERLLWRLTEKIICNSNALCAALQALGVPAAHLACIPNGVDPVRFAPAAIPPSARAPVILCVARLARDKDHLTLFRAFEHLVLQIPHARLRIVGDGPEYSVLRAWAANHAAGRNIDFFPGTDDVGRHYAEARLFALASIREGQPNVLLEAMACGLPVCASTVGGIPALVGNNGLLSPAGNATALADNCALLLADPRLCDVMGRAGRERVEQDFSFSRMVAAHEDLFVRLWEDCEKRVGRKGRAAI